MPRSESGPASLWRSPLWGSFPLLRGLRALATPSALFLICSVLAFGQAGNDAEEMLRSVRQSVMDTVRQLPKYVCTQTVDRVRYEPANPQYGTYGTRRTRSCDDTIADARRDGWKRQPSSADRLRLDVAVEHERPGIESEMYSWAGENRFSDRDLFEFVRDGAISTGSFSSMLASIFGNDAARFSYEGDSQNHGRLLSEFSFRIPQQRSQFLYVFGESRQDQVAVAYDGTILVDPASSDLVRLLIRTGQLPRETGACELRHELDYSRVHLNGRDFLLPSEARATFLHVDATEAENRIQYSACHEFHGESTVHFEASREEQGSAPVAESAASPVLLPARLPFKVTFTDAINTATAAAGDAIRGRLKTAIRDRSGVKVLVPAGAPVSGRILRVQRSFHSAVPFASNRRDFRAEPAPSLVIQIRLETLDLGEGPEPFKAVFDSGVHRFPKQNGPNIRLDIGSMDELHTRANESDIGTFEFWDSDPNHAVKSGLDSNWFTAAP
ncbi:MAG: hypothetical protein JO336_17145 [Acidobacteriia bacterium]|nr:hypothetical protein [Terriglobia bacterium]